MNIKNIVVALILVGASLWGWNSCASMVGPGFKEKELADGSVIKIPSRDSFKPIAKYDPAHVFYQGEVNRAILNGGMVAYNPLRNDSDLVRPGVDVRGDNSTSFPLYDPTLDAMAVPINPGHPEIQIRQYFSPEYDKLYTFKQIYWGESTLTSDTTSEQAREWSMKWWRAENENDKRLVTNNIGLRKGAPFGARDGDFGLYELDQYGNIHSMDERECRVFWTGDSQGRIVIDYQPGGETERMRRGRRHQDQGEPKPTFVFDPSHWYWVWEEYDRAGERYRVWISDRGNPSDPISPLQFNGRAVLVLDHPVFWNNSNFSPYVVGFWINSSGRQEGDWGNHMPMVNYTRNWLVSNKPIHRIGTIPVGEFPDPIQD